jgi:hypothetical protein
MSQAASHHKSHFSSALPAECKSECKSDRSLKRVARAPRGRKESELTGKSNHVCASPMHDIPFGAIHVDAAGIVLEHRPKEVGDAAQAQQIIGRQIASIAPWASTPSLLAGLRSAIDSTRVNFHFDFKTLANSAERIIHVNILAAGDQTAWIFISDKTIPMLS